MKLWLGMGVISAVLCVAFAAVPFAYQNERAGGSSRRIALSAKIRALDPQDITDTISESVAGNIFETLYTYHFLKRPYELIPLLAEDMPVISADGLTWTIKIAKGILFADDPAFKDGKGRELVAEDFVYAWKRMADLKNESANYSNTFEDGVVGLDEFREYTGKVAVVDYDRPVEGLKAIDRYTLRMKLTKPNNFLLYWLAKVSTAPVAREAVEKDGEEIVNHPVGTGRYILIGNFRSNSFSMVRNKSYRRTTYPTTGEDSDRAAGFLDDAGKELPMVEQADWVVIEENQPRWLAFMDGLLDSSGIPKDNFHQAVTTERELSGELGKKGIKLLKVDNPDIYYFGFNMDDPVVGKLKPLRQAMSMAYDRATFIDKFLNGRGKIPVGPVPPMFPGFRKDKVNPYVKLDRKRAKELIAEAEKLNGGPIPTLKLAMGGSDTEARQYGEFFEIQMKEIGLKIEVDYMTWPRLQDALKSRSHQIFQLGWVADYPDAQNFLLLFYSKNKSPGNNGSNYDNPEFDKLYDAALKEPDIQKRIPLYQQMEDIVIEDCPWILTEYGIGYVLYYDWLHNYKPNDYAAGTLKYQRLDVARRKELLEKH